MPPASKRKRTGGGGAGGSKRGKRSKKMKKSDELVVSDGSDDDQRKNKDDDDDDDDEEGDSEWVVEEVVDKRIGPSGKTEYFLKWRNWPPSTNTWEPIEHLENCPELVAAFEAKRANEGNREVSSASSRRTAPSGFDEGLTARAVRGVVQLESGSNGQKELFYLVEWEDTDRLEKINAKVVREKIPEEVIKYLQTKITWKKRRTRDTEKKNSKSNSITSFSSASRKSKKAGAKYDSDSNSSSKGTNVADDDDDDDDD